MLLDVIKMFCIFGGNAESPVFNKTSKTSTKLLFFLFYGIKNGMLFYGLSYTINCSYIFMIVSKRPSSYFVPSVTQGSKIMSRVS